MKWLDKKTAPKDGAIILADVGLPWAVVASWNQPENRWVYANCLIGLYEGRWHDTYFENEYAEDIRGWMRLPKLK
jgi:hypothetical protein